MQLSQLNFNHLFYFHTIATEGSIYKAANKLHVTRPTISDQLKQLESTLGVELFDRKGRGLLLNQNGHLVYSYTKSAFRSFEDLLTNITRSEGTSVETIRVGITSTLSKSYALDSLINLIKNKKYYVTISENPDPSVLSRQLESQEIDAIITEHRPKKGQKKKYISRTLATEDYSWVISKSLYAKLKVSKKNYSKIPVIQFTSDSPHASQLSDFFERLGVDPLKVGEANNLNLLILSVKKEIASAILPLKAINSELKSKNFRVIEKVPEMSTKLNIIYNPRTLSESALERLSKI